MQRFRALLDRDYQMHKTVASTPANSASPPTPFNRVYREVLGKPALPV